MARRGGGKRLHRDRIAALFAVSQTRHRKRTPQGRQERRAYRCLPRGGALHLTSRPAA